MKSKHTRTYRRGSYFSNQSGTRSSPSICGHSPYNSKGCFLQAGLPACCCDRPSPITPAYGSRMTMQEWSGTLQAFPAAGCSHSQCAAAEGCFAPCLPRRSLPSSRQRSPLRAAPPFCFAAPLLSCFSRGFLQQMFPVPHVLFALSNDIFFLCKQ